MKRSVWAICTVLVLFAFSTTIYGQSQSGQVDVNTQVPGAPPSTPAIITKPVNGDRFTTDIIAIEGTCVPYVTVELYTNNLFIGSAPCLAAGTFTLQAQLAPGINILLAKQRDSLDQYSSDSSPVTVYYDKSTVTPTPGSPASSPQPSAQGELFRLLTDVVYRGARTNKSTLITIEIRGGVKPFAVGIDWGDGVYELASRADVGTFGQGHVYSKPGEYIIKIRGKDEAGNEAYIQTYAIVTGDAAASEQKPNYGPSHLEKVINEIWHWTWWILLIIAVFLLGFRLGRRRRNNG